MLTIYGIGMLIALLYSAWFERDMFEKETSMYLAMICFTAILWPIFSVIIVGGGVWYAVGKARKK